MWTAILAAIFATFGPQLIALLESLLSKWFGRAAALLPTPATIGDERAQKLALIDGTIHTLPYAAFARRALLRRMRAVIALTTPPTADDIAEITDMASAADQE